MGSRDLRLDGLKFFLVCLVVISHCIQSFRYDDIVVGWTVHIIHSFHMPLFVILSGYFYKLCDWNKELRKSLRLIETFVVVTLVFWLTDGMKYSWPLVRLGICPSWYLFSLVCWRLLSNVLLRHVSDTRLLVYSIVVSVLAYILLNKGEGLFSIMRSIQFYPYFLLGYTMKTGSVSLNRVPKTPVYIVSGIITTVIAMLVSYPLFAQECQSTGLFRWCDTFNKSIVAGGGYYLLVKIASLANSFTIWKGIKVPDSICTYGQSTLAVYAFNTMTFPLIYHYCTHLWMSICAAILTIVISLFLNRIGLAKYLINPITSIIITNKTI